MSWANSVALLLLTTAIQSIALSIRCTSGSILTSHRPVMDSPSSGPLQILVRLS
ncbi:hypothetical protein DPMN_194291 [Dreissena polymorpha]|uniref:Uncharacterized protein n=1 Tax=Dreissena polymorpha TaxID=45954 RepID=A0A9D4BF57_DREPO|nr:hypothetical protein DPMN_194291 [Dreissena polymorpha]